LQSRFTVLVKQTQNGLQSRFTVKRPGLKQTQIVFLNTVYYKFLSGSVETDTKQLCRPRCRTIFCSTLFFLLQAVILSI